MDRGSRRRGLDLARPSRLRAELSELRAVVQEHAHPCERRRVDGRKTRIEEKYSSTFEEYSVVAGLDIIVASSWRHKIAKRNHRR
jgi:hypothetical protein